MNYLLIPLKILSLKVIFILTWMGLKFLAEAIGQGLGELVSTLENAVWRAWIAADNDRMFPGYEIDQAARGLARCVGILFRLILQGVVALILGKGGVSVGKGMASTGRSVLTKGIQGTADVNVADVVAQLRQSKLPKAFADWVEQNWEDLLRNPKLQTGKAEPVSSAVDASNAATPSQLKTRGTGKEAIQNGEAGLESQVGTPTAIKQAIPKHSASFGNALTSDYRSTFFEANPDLKGQVVVHHAVEQQVLTKFPGTVTDSEIHSLENLRGIPNEINPDIHLSKIRIEWNRFYKQYIGNGIMPTKTQLLEKATDIDDLYGSQFKPPIGE